MKHIKNAIYTLAVACALLPGAAMQSEAQSGSGYNSLRAERREDCPQPRRTSPVDAGFDVLHYRVAISVDPAIHFIAGTVSADILATSPTLDSLTFHLADNMNIGAVALDGAPVPFLHDGGRIAIPTGGFFAAGDTISLSVSYDGYPLDQGLRFRSESIYNVSEPDMARNWFPCYDHPWDKATAEMIVTVPDTLYCASNGLLEASTHNPDGTITWHWRTRYPLPTYTASIAVAPYEIFSHWYHYSELDSMEMPNYVFPDRMDAARVTLSNVPAMMEYFAGRFGDYPFLQEKYGTALVQMNGAMENFTCTILDRRRADGTTDHDWVLAHELAHSWFGNSVTMRDWSDIWLNEGFATYGDALWKEESEGEAALRERMEFFKAEYFAEDASSRFPTYDPDFLWGATVYEKGAWILHMLRYVMGDEAFFESLRQYHQQYRYGSATTAQFRQVCETVSSIPLGAFFDEWVYQAGYPEYELAWWYDDTPGGFETTIRLRQVQQNAPVFTIPAEVRITTASGDTLVRITPQSADDQFQVALQAQPLEIAFDPDVRILKTYREIPSSTLSTFMPAALLVAVSPNPCTGGTVRFDFYLAEAGNVRLEIFDVRGRRVARVLDEPRSVSWNSAFWRAGSVPETGSNSGVYFYRLTTRTGSASGKVTIIR